MIKSYYVKLPLSMWNEKDSVYITLWLSLHSLAILKIDELLLTANSPKLSDLTIWRVTVNT